jgi:hypothetical protein
LELAPRGDEGPSHLEGGEGRQEEHRRQQRAAGGPPSHRRRLTVIAGAS